MTEGPSGHTYLRYNAPLGEDRVADLIGLLGPLDVAQVLDLGCGWAELTLQLLDANPSARAIGVDTDDEAIERGRAAASARGLDDRIELHVGDAVAHAAAPNDVVVAIGVGHAFGGAAGLFEAIGAHVRPGGLLVVGEEIWERSPTPEALSVLGADESDCPDLAGLVDMAIAAGYRPLDVSSATQREWDRFESLWCAGRERWLLAHPDHPEAAEARAVVDRHRDGWLRAYRGILGFGYLILARPADG